MDRAVRGLKNLSHQVAQPVEASGAGEHAAPPYRVTAMWSDHSVRTAPETTEPKSAMFADRPEAALKGAFRGSETL